MYIYIYTLYNSQLYLPKFRVGTSSDSNFDGGSTSIIAGSLGGAAVFFIIVLCAVILYVKLSYKKRSYDHALHGKVSGPQATTIKMDSNPSYGRVQGCNACDLTEPEYDIAIQSNPSYSFNSEETTKMSEDQDYVETNLQSTQRADYLEITGSTAKEEESIYDNDTDSTGNVQINPNPFIYDSVSGDVKLEDNPSYKYI